MPRSVTSTTATAMLPARRATDSAVASQTDGCCSAAHPHVPHTEAPSGDASQRHTPRWVAVWWRPAALLPLAVALMVLMASGLRLDIGGGDGGRLGKPRGQLPARRFLLQPEDLSSRPPAGVHPVTEGEKDTPVPRCQMVSA